MEHLLLLDHSYLSFKESSKAQKKKSTAEEQRHLKSQAVGAVTQIGTSFLKPQHYEHGFPLDNLNNISQHKK